MPIDRPQAFVFCGSGKRSPGNYDQRWRLFMVGLGLEATRVEIKIRLAPRLGLDYNVTHRRSSASYARSSSMLHCPCKPSYTTECAP